MGGLILFTMVFQISKGQSMYKNKQFLDMYGLVCTALQSWFSRHIPEYIVGDMDSARDEVLKYYTSQVWYRQ